MRKLALIPILARSIFVEPASHLLSAFTIAFRGAFGLPLPFGRASAVTAAAAATRCITLAIGVSTFALLALGLALILAFLSFTFALLAAFCTSGCRIARAAA